MSDITRAMFGRFGIASKPSGRDFMAWATEGPTEADSPVHERSNFVVFEFARTEKEAVEKIKKELCDLGIAEPEPSFMIIPLPTPPDIMEGFRPAFLMWGGFFAGSVLTGLIMYGLR